MHGGVEKFVQPNQDVADYTQPVCRTDFESAALLELTQPAPLFDPVYHFLDASADVDRLGVALMASCAVVDR